MQVRRTTNVGPTEIRGHRGTLSQINRDGKLRGNGNKIAREYVAASLRSKSSAIRVVHGWNKLPEEVIRTGSVCDFKERPDSVGITLLGGKIVNCMTEELVGRMRLINSHP